MYLVKVKAPPVVCKLPDKEGKRTEKLAGKTGECS